MKSPKLLSDNACQHPCANLCVLLCVARAGDFPLPRAALPFERSEWQRTRVDNVLSFSDATLGGLLWSGLS